MIEVLGRAFFDTSADNVCLIEIRDKDGNAYDAPFQEDDFVKLEFTDTTDKKKLAFEGNYFLTIVVDATDNNRVKVAPKDFPTEAEQINGATAQLSDINNQSTNCKLTLLELKIPASTAVSPELQSLEPSAEIELFKLTFDKNVNGQTVSPYYYHAGTNEIKTSIVFNKITYVALPVKVTGFNKTTRGTRPRPKFEIANTDSAISALLSLYNPIHAELLRIKTCKKFLDAVNFTSGTNDNADPTAIFEADDRWYVDRVLSEDPTTVVFELNGKIDMTNLRLPKRKYRESKIKV
tara:strand:+ start:360 stop:1238 length:879 start_codon:yes stop_codon:yes gene_type:complete